MALSHVMNLVSNSGLVGAGNTGAGGGGGGGNLDSQAVTVGEYTQNNAGGSGVPSSTTVYRGYQVPTNTFGSISDGTSNIYSGASIQRIMYYWNTVFDISGVSILIDGTNLANLGWTTLTIGSLSVARTNASYSGNVGGDTQWTWTIGGGDYTGANDPFGANGTTTNCVFT